MDYPKLDNLEYDRVEEGISKVLEEYGLEDYRADFLSKALFSDWRFTRDTPPMEEVLDIYDERAQAILEEIPLEDVITDEANSEQVKREMKQVVREGLEGEISGPAALREELSRAEDELGP